MLSVVSLLPTLTLVSAAAASCAHNFITYNVGYGVRIKARARIDQKFAVESAVLSRVLSISILIKAGGKGTTRCPWHCINDHISKYTDLAPDKISLKPGARRTFVVTGIPFSYSKKIRCSSKSLGKLAGATHSLNIKKIATNNDKPMFMKPIVDGMDEKELLSFFKKRNGRYILHCGCDLEHVLLDFYFWKRVTPLVSESLGVAEEFGAPLDPRTRMYFYLVLTALGVTVDDLYLYDKKGVRRHEGNAPDIMRTVFKAWNITLDAVPPKVKKPRVREYVDLDDDIAMSLPQVQFDDTEDEDGDGEAMDQNSD